MKNQFIITLILIMTTLSCNSNNKNSNRANNIKTYFLNYDIRNVNYEIFLNDILVGQSINNNGLPAPINLNSYIFKNGQQHVRIKLIAPFKEKLTKEIVNEVNKSLSIHLLNDNDDSKIREVVKLNFPAIEMPIQHYEYKWTFEAAVIEGMDDLDQSKDLTKMGKDELQKEVVNKYEELRKLLNNGNGKEFIKEIEKAKTSLYFSENIQKNKQAEYTANLEEYFDSHKGTMPPITNFILKIMGNGRAIALENNSNHKGLGILSSEDIQNKTLNLNYIILHKPIGSDKFEVFRYNCTFTSLD